MQQVDSVLWWLEEQGWVVVNLPAVQQKCGLETVVLRFWLKIQDHHQFYGGGLDLAKAWMYANGKLLQVFLHGYKWEATGHPS